MPIKYVTVITKSCTKMLPRTGSIMKRTLLTALSDPINLERPHAMDLHNIAFRHSEMVHAFG